MTDDLLGEYRRAVTNYAFCGTNGRKEITDHDAAEIGTLEAFEKMIVPALGWYDDVYGEYVMRMRESFKNRPWFEEVV